MKTTIILHVILMTIAMNIAVDIIKKKSINIPTNPDAEERFFLEFYGVYNETEGNLDNNTRAKLNLDQFELEFLKNKILSCEYAKLKITPPYKYRLQCQSVLDKSALDNNSSFRQVESLCVATTTYKGRDIGYRRSPRHNELVYVFAYKPIWYNRNPPKLSVWWPMIVVDLVHVPLEDVASSAY